MERRRYPSGRLEAFGDRSLVRPRGQNQVNIKHHSAAWQWVDVQVMGSTRVTLATGRLGRENIIPGSEGDARVEG